MNATFEQQVRERAYALWEASGMDAGSADKHWLCAEQAMRNETEHMRGAPMMAAKKTKAAAAKPAASSKNVKAASPRKSAKMSAGASA